MHGEGIRQARKLFTSHKRECDRSCTYSVRIIEMDLSGDTHMRGSESKRSRLQFNRASWHHMSDRQLLLVHHDTIHDQLQDFLFDFIFWVLKDMVHTGTEL